MVEEKDRFGETMKLLERAKEDIYFAQRDRELLEKLKAQLHKVEDVESKLDCPKGHGLLETYTFQGFVLDRCQSCGGVWMDNGELEGIIRKVARGPLSHWLDKLIGKGDQTEAQT
jgi:Zn-finger nucleic acid-binding protein